MVLLAETVFGLDEAYAESAELKGMLAGETVALLVEDLAILVHALAIPTHHPVRSTLNARLRSRVVTEAKHR